MAAAKLAFLLLHYDVRIKGYDLKFRREEFEYVYFMIMKKKEGVKFSSQWYFKTIFSWFFKSSNEIFDA